MTTTTSSHSTQPPFATAWVIRGLLVIIVGLALAAGYYHNAWVQLQKKYQKQQIQYLKK